MAPPHEGARLTRRRFAWSGLRLREPSDQELQSALDLHEPSSGDLEDMVRSQRDTLLRDDHARRVWVVALLAAEVALLWPTRHMLQIQLPDSAWFVATAITVLASQVLARPLRMTDAQDLAHLIVNRRFLPLTPAEAREVERIEQSSLRAEFYIRKIRERRWNLRVAEYDRLRSMFVIGVKDERSSR